MRHLITLALFLIPLTVEADQPRHRSVFASANGKYELRQELEQLPRQIWSLTEKASGAVRYQVVGDFTSRTVLLSDDGVNLVVVDDYSERQPGPNLDVLLFYRNGIQVKKYSLGDLLRDTSNIESSVSHFRWFFRLSALAAIDAKVKLETFELISYEFDVRTGDLLKKEPNPVLSEGSIYVYGKIKKLGGGRFEIEVCQQVHGVIPKDGKIEFGADRDGAIPFDGSYYSVVIGGGRLIAKQDVILNSCNYQRGKRPRPRRAKQPHAPAAPPTRIS